MTKVVVLGLICFVFLFFVSCSSGNNSSNSGATATTAEKSIPIVKVKNEKIEAGMPVYSFRVMGQQIDKDNSSANKIEIYNNNNLVQEISFKQTDVPSENVGSIIEDMNFDGYKDIRIQNSQPDGPNKAFYYWLWNKETGKFVESLELEKIISPVFDGKNKLITSFIRTSISNYNFLTYKYENGMPLLFKEADTVFVNDTKKHIIEKALVKGKMKITKEYDEAN